MKGKLFKIVIGFGLLVFALNGIVLMENSKAKAKTINMELQNLDLDIDNGTVICDFESDTCGFGSSYWNGRDCNLAFNGSCSYYGQESADLSASTSVSFNNNLTYAVRLKDSPSGDAGQFRLVESSSGQIGLAVTPSNNPANVTFEKNKWYQVHIYDVNISNNSYSLSIYQNRTKIGGVQKTFRNNVNTLDEMYVSSENNVYVNFDYIRKNSSFVNKTQSSISTSSSNNITRKLQLRVSPYMEYNGSQKYTVTFDDGTPENVTANATVTSDNSSVIKVYQSNFTLKATNNSNISKKVTIRATYTNDSETYYSNKSITVATLTLDNVGILSPLYSTIAVIGNSYIQYIIFVIIAGIGTTLVINEFAGIGMMLLMIIFGWVAGWLNLGIMISSLFFAMFIFLNSEIDTNEIR
jgi:hypothetical protein